MRLPDVKAELTSTFGRILKMDSTKKIINKLAEPVRGTAMWATNVGNEVGAGAHVCHHYWEGDALIPMAKGMIIIHIICLAQSLLLPYILLNPKRARLFQTLHMKREGAIMDCFKRKDGAMLKREFVTLVYLDYCVIYDNENWTFYSFGHFHNQWYTLKFTLFRLIK